MKKWQIEHRKRLIERNFKHGMAGTPTHRAWKAMRGRCNNLNHKRRKYYGGRGIKVCKEWDDFKNFLKDMGEKPKGKSLDRIDVNGNYEPSNCRWATQREQTNNSTKTRYLTINGVTKSFSDWCRLTGKDYFMTYNRIVRWGWDPKKVLDLK